MTDPRPADESLRPILASIEATRRRMEESPFRCSGCGERVLREGMRCQQCRESQEKEEVSRARLVATNANMPRHYQWAAFAAPELPPRVRDKGAIAKANAAALNPNIERIVFAGSAGAGKTTLATACVKLWSHDRGLTGQYVTARALSMARSQTGLGEEANVVSTAIKAGILLIDDIGLDDAQQFGSAVLDTIYARHAEGRLTAVTLAIAPNELEGRYGTGFARRLVEDNAVLVNVRLLGVAPGAK